MKTSINKHDEQLERLIADIEATGDAMKIVCHDVRGEVEDGLFNPNPLPEGVPSRASFAELGTRRLKKYVHEITELVKDLDAHLFDNYLDKK